ncbi:hypothetical protein MUY27_12120 [Mucilaginibacter sp. RS28]|uniref:Uncharacterized protein n=1 Tax=Mucilaginibacter straminoryzae TaxID=2932774 RepID=A0A9X1X8F2_9SPHI|nr:hypothetical protein [Mucilaginibacter straminoryzae]MCJ8210454.1 hypothetical protein [Mucilaginibacter straminoryzae]
MMPRIKAKNILLVAPGVPDMQVLDASEKVRHVTRTSEVFPAIFELLPDLIILDHDFLGADLERIVRRIRSNNFYNKIKICCHKQKEGVKEDGLLAAIGVNYFLYEQAEKKKSAFALPKSVSTLFNSAVLNVAVQ